ncbi:MAG: hypothetical protein C0473_03555 [Cyanobacteria bacterium DS3.002]|nr:hypothetical protein [Cyanobacteria bacterium DS3.002]
MQKHPMLSVKEAAEALRIDERSVRDRLTNGTLKGEKKMVGLREKWFIYSGAVQSALAKQDDLGDMAFAINTQSAYEQSAIQTVDATSVMVQDREDAQAPSYRPTEPQEVEDATYGDLDDITPRSAREPLRGEWRAEGQVNLQSFADAFMKPVLEKVAAQERAIVEQAALLEAQQKEIEEQKIQLRLLPDLQKLARDEAEAAKAAELKLHEAAALKKQAELVVAAKVEALRLKEEELAMLQKNADEERLTSLKQHSEIKALSEQIANVEEEKKNLEARASEALQLGTHLKQLERKVEELQRPWWKKFLNKGNSHSTSG